MITDIDFRTFYDKHIDNATKIARFELANYKKRDYNWNKLIDEEAIVIEVVDDSIWKTYENFDPEKGFKVVTYMRTIISHEISNHLKKEKAYLEHRRGLNIKSVACNTIQDVATRIPQESLEKLIKKMKSAILKLPPCQRVILSLYLKNPKTYIDEAVRELGISRNNVSVHKSRALDRLPSLMQMTPNDYFDNYPANYYMGFITAEAPQPAYSSSVYPSFDLDATASMLAMAISLQWLTNGQK